MLLPVNEGGLGIDKVRFDFDTSLTNDSPYPVLENIAVRC